jgi:PhnB protein
MNASTSLSERPDVAQHVNPTPKGYHTITPYLMVKGAVEAIRFYTRVFHASEIMRIPGPEGKVMHAEIKIGDSTVMLADEMPNCEFKSPQSMGGSPVALLAYVDDVDACSARALAAGAKQIKPVENQFYGDRSGTLADPFGHIWTISTHVEDVSPEELQRRMAEMKPCG